MSSAKQTNYPVEVLGYGDYKKAAKTLYKSFDDDDVARYSSRHLEHDPAYRKKVDIALYEAYVYSHLIKGMVVGIKGDETDEGEDSDCFETVSIWVRPDSGEVDDYLTMLRSGFAKLAWMTGAEGRKRIFKDMFPVLHDNAVDILGDEAENCWTLVYLGSAPKARGKGNVRKIFDYMFKNHIDPNNNIAYLESSHLVNIPIYEKFGFRGVSDIWLGNKEDPIDKARMDVMIRGPQGKEWSRLKETRERRGYIIPENSTLK